MSEGLVKPLDGKALLIEAVVDRYGERCSDYQAGCACCAAWRNIDRIEELEAKLAKAVDGLTQIERTYYQEAANPSPETIRRMSARMNGIARDTQAVLAEINGGSDE